MSLGSMIVRLGLDASEFVRGLGRAESQAKRFRKDLEDQVSSLRGVAVSLAAVGAAAGAAFLVVDKLARNVAEFQDAGERIGDSAESFASLAVAAGTAGVSMQEIEGASIKLTKAISGLDEESKAAVKALTALGIPLKEFKALNPVDQLEAVAKAMAKFGDGAGKTAVAVAAFGKGGAQMLPFLKELGQEGGRQVILLQNQIKLADEYADRQAKLTTQIKLYAAAAATHALPAINDLTEALKRSIQQLLNADLASSGLKANASIESWANTGAKAIAFLVDYGDAAVRTFIVLTSTIQTGLQQTAAMARGDIKEAIELGRQWQRELKATLDRPLFSENLAAARAARERDTGFGMGSRDEDFKLPELKFAGAVAEQVSKAKRELDELQKFLDRMGAQQFAFDFGLDEKTIADLERLGEAVRRGLDPQLAAKFRDQIFAADSATKRLHASLAEEAALRTRATESAKEYLQRIQDEAAAVGLSTEALIQHNNALRLRDTLAGINDPKTKTDVTAIFEAARAIEIRTAADIKAADAALRGVEAGKDLVKRYEDEAGALGKTGLALEQYTIGLAKEAALLGVVDETARANITRLHETAAVLAATIDAQRTFMNDAIQLNDAFRSSFADNLAAVADGSKSFGDAVKAMAKDWVGAMNRIAANKLADAVFGGQGSTGGGLFGDLSKYLASLFNFSGGGGGSSDFGMFTRALGGPVAANTPYLVGERGREMFVPRTAGTIVPNNEIRNIGGTTINNNIHQVVNVPAGTSRQSATQTLSEAGRRIQYAIERKR